MNEPARSLRAESIAKYERDGFLASLPVLTEQEVEWYRQEVERTCQALGGAVTRLDRPHRFFDWAWKLATHPRVLDHLEELLGPNLLMKDTKVFYKHPGTQSFVAWHQDGYYDNMQGGYVPVVWLALTNTSVENGCLRVVPGSHRKGLIAHSNRPHPNNLTGGGMTADIEIKSAFDIIMQPGEMSLHHPAVLHGSNLNRSASPRIGFATTYFTPELAWSRDPVVLLRGSAPNDRYEYVDGPPGARFEEAVEAYLRLYADEIRFVNR